MADKNLREAALAEAAHQAEYKLGEALAAPAGPNRLGKIAAADAAVIEANQAYDDCLAGRGYTIPHKR
jgi:hypothetical protein